MSSFAAIWNDGHAFCLNLSCMKNNVSRSFARLRRRCASEQRWRNLTEALPQLVWSAMPDGSCDYFSAQWTEHTGVPEADLLGCALARDSASGRS